MNSKSPTTVSLPLLHAHLRLQLLSLLISPPPELVDQLGSQGIEYFGNFGAIFGGALIVVYLIFCGHLLSPLPVFVRDVQFVAYQVNALLGHVFLEGLVNVVVAAFEAAEVGEVEYADAALGALVVAAGERAELFLASSVPDLQGVELGCDLGGVCFEVDAHRGQVGSVELGLAQAEEHAAFADSLRTHDYHLECSHLHILVGVVHDNILMTQLII